jgi:peptidyl-prolyl cis-trans isomerase B (cyclophilin B)
MPVMRSRLLAGTPVLVLLAALTACSDDDRSGSAEDDTTSSSAPASEDDATSPSAAADGACAYEPDGSSSDVELPPADPTETGEVAAVIATTAGDLRVTLDGANAPCTVNSFLSLAEQGYFDGTPCHRLTSYATLAVLQCGDPSGQGTGGPGYTVPDELETAGDYSAGTLAMANSGMPNSGGSQFFIVYGDSQLDPVYTVFGKVDRAGIDAIAKVAADGSTPAEDGAPNTPVEIVGVSQG